MTQVSKNHGGARTSTTGRSWFVAGLLAIGLLLYACGGQTSEGNGADTSTPADESAVTATTAVSEPEDSTPSTASEGGDGGQQDGSDSLFGDFDFEGGSATLTIAGETVEFDFFECFSDEAAVEFYGEDATFAAVGQTETNEGPATLFLVSIDGPFGPNYTTFYNPDGRGEKAWQDVGGDAAFTVDGAHVTHQGDFSRIIDGALTEETDPGTVDATCG